MDATGSCFQLSSEDIIELRQQGVSGRVINEMQARRAPRPVVIHQPVVIAPPPPYYEPGPVVGVRVGGRF
jgi:hypothetical protein